MNAKIGAVLRDVVGPMFRRPRSLQVAALCHRRTKAGQKEVLLVTSRGTGRWILPKGWPMRGKSDAQAAAQEAWEEALQACLTFLIVCTMHNRAVLGHFSNSHFFTGLITMFKYQHPPPTLGQHNREILEEMGLSAEEIDDLVSSGAI